MDTQFFSAVLSAYGFLPDNCMLAPFGSGLINRTFLLTDNGSGKRYILQKVNTSVFRHPEQIASNLLQLKAFFSQHAPDYHFNIPLTTLAGNMLFYYANRCYRLFAFEEGSITYNVPESPALAGKAAAAFGHFSALLTPFPAKNLQNTIPHFHDLRLRYEAFEKAMAQGNPERKQASKAEAGLLQQWSDIAATYRMICESPAFRLRVMHHDTKISNILFDHTGRVICLVDLDTVMPGYFISDVGDMMRNYLSPAGEEETDFGKIHIQMPYFEALAAGYLGEMAPVLSDAEKKHFVYSGHFLTYMQALRFYTDYLMNDVYYPVQHETHNLVRTQNQIVLLEKMKESGPQMEEIVADLIS